MKSYLKSLFEVFFWSGREEEEEEEEKKKKEEEEKKKKDEGRIWAKIYNPNLKGGEKWHPRWNSST